MMTPTKTFSHFLICLLVCLCCAGCFQWGIGDPDQSQIEKKLIGVWYYEDENHSTVVNFRPFDQRTYAIDYMTLNGTLEEAKITDRFMVKGWHVKVQNVLFLVAEWLGPYQDEKAKNVRFTISQLEFLDDTTARLRHIKHDYPAVKAATTQAEFEKAIRNNVLADEMYDQWYTMNKVDYQRAAKLYHPE